MTIIDDAQTTAIYYGKGAALPANISDAGNIAQAQAPVTATAFQVSTKRSATLYVNVRTAASLATAIGPDNTTAIVLDAAQSDAIGMTTIHLPAGWWVKLTGTMANLSVTAVLN